MNRKFRVMNISIMNNLSIEDLKDLSILSGRINDDPQFWEIIKRFTVLAQLRRKKPVSDVLDFSTLDSAEKVQQALLTSLACEWSFAYNGRAELARFFKSLTTKIDALGHSMN